MEIWVICGHYKNKKTVKNHSFKHILVKVW
jgi:hypothetical protein